MRKIITIAAGLAAAAAVAGCKSSTVQASHERPASPAAATSSAAPAPHAAGKFHGSCDYTLGSSPATGTANAVGEIDLHNTGNVPTTVRVKISWPQEGYPALRMARSVRTRPGTHKTVRFHRPLSYTQITLLQAWQTDNDFADGCTYHARITDPQQ